MFVVLTMTLYESLILYRLVVLLETLGWSQNRVPITGSLSFDSRDP